MGTKWFKVKMRVSVQLQRALNDTRWWIGVEPCSFTTVSKRLSNWPVKKLSTLLHFLRHKYTYENRHVFVGVTLTVMQKYTVAVTDKETYRSVNCVKIWCKCSYFSCPCTVKKKKSWFVMTFFSSVKSTMWFR